MIYPVSVVIPHTKSRASFFHEVCLPSVERNNPAQIIVVDREGGACEKRNEGAARALHDYLLFVDDDAELAPNCLEVMMEALELHPGAAFAYGDVMIVPHGPGKYPFTKVATGWNFESLRRSNYIDVTALMRKDVFPGFDPEIKRLQDWDLWLTIAERGGRGMYVRRITHLSHKIDKTISDREDYDASAEKIRAKHNIV